MTRALARCFQVALVVCCYVTAPLQANPVVDQCHKKVEEALSDLDRLYQKELEELKLVFQRKGDLDGYLETEEELKRFEKQKQLAEIHFSKKPGPLRWVQSNSLQSRHSVTYNIANSHINSLLPEQVQLTKAGKISEAVLIKQAIESIRAQYEPSFALFEMTAGGGDGDSISAERLADFCEPNRDFAVATLKGKRMRIYGVIDRVERDFSKSAIFHVYLKTNQGADMRVDLQFSSENYSYKESSDGERTVATVRRIGDDAAPVYRLIPGEMFEAEATFDGIHLNVMLTGATFPTDSTINSTINRSGRVEAKPKK